MTIPTTVTIAMTPIVLEDLHHPIDFCFGFCLGLRGVLIESGLCFSAGGMQRGDHPVRTIEILSAPSKKRSSKSSIPS